MLEKYTRLVVTRSYAV